MTEGFRVDLSALSSAAEGVQETIDSMNKRQVRDIDCPADAFGHDRLATTVANFCDRWNLGVHNLIDDAQEISGRLAHCVQVYRQTDAAVQAHFEGMVHAPGDDPAAR